MATACIFCQIAQKKAPHHLIDENENFMAFLTIFPNTKGATVVIPKQHYASYAFDLEDNVLVELVKYTKTVAKKLDAYFPDVGRTAMVFEGFGVDHVHAKLFPMHGTVQQHTNWQAIHSKVDKYFEQYEGYISSHDYIRAHDNELAALATAIRTFQCVEKNSDQDS
jgi:histidine triad (HIT) family protein